MSAEHSSTEFAEVQAQPNIDLAYIRALGGDTTLAAAADDYYQAAIKAAAKCMKVSGRVLRDLSGGMPGFDEVAEHMDQNPSLVDLHLCAEMLEGELPTGRQVAKYGHKALEVTAVVLGSPFSLASTILRAKGHGGAGTVAEGVTHALHVPARIAEEAIGSAEHTLAAAARHYVIATYGKLEEAFGASINAAWLWATLLSRTAALPEQLNGVPNYFADRFLQTVGSMGRSIDELPVPIRTLAVHLSNRTEVTAETGEIFLSVAKSSRTARQKQLVDNEARRVRGSRPSKEVLDDFVASNEAYHRAAGLPFDEVQSQLKVALDSFVDAPNSTQAHQTTTQLFAVIVERVGANYPDNQAFADLLGEHFGAMARVAYRYILRALDVGAGASDVASVRLLTDVLLHPSAGVINKTTRARLASDLDKAACEWFSHPHETFMYNRSVLTFMREAYLLDRLRSRQSGSHALDTLRAKRFLQAAHDPKAAIVVNSRKLNPVFQWAYEKVRAG